MMKGSSKSSIAIGTEVIIEKNLNKLILKSKERGKKTLRQVSAAGSEEGRLSRNQQNRASTLSKSVRSAWNRQQNRADRNTTHTVNLQCKHLTVCKKNFTWSDT